MPSFSVLRQPFALLFHFVLSPLYEDVVESHDVWFVLNWFMAFGIIVALVTTFIAKRNGGTEDRDTNTYIRVNVSFYVSVMLAALFFWNWINELIVGGGNESDTRGIFWVVINTVFIPSLAASASVFGTTPPASRRLGAAGKRGSP